MDRYTGTILKDRYVLEDMIGSGGMAVVYRATDRVTGNDVAVKILKDEFVADEQFRRRFLNESRAISMLRHRNIVSVIDFEFEGNLQYIVMEYIDGITLKDFIRTQKAIPYTIAVKITMQILSALQHAHERGIIHRDIKPQNIMILSDGTIKVMDFGIARISKFETVTMTDKAIGTVYYISPEQARGEHTDEKSDIYSVGVMLYEMLTGALPFDGDTPVSVAIKQIQSTPKEPRQINKMIPVGLEQIVRRAMMKTPEKRYASAIDMINDLKLVLADPAIVFHFDLVEELPQDQDVLSLTDPDKGDGKFWTKGNIIAIAGGVLAALLVIGLVIWFLASGGEKTPDQIEVPRFIEQLYETVAADPEIAENFSITKQEEANADVEAGVIFEQSLEAGTMVDPGTEIVLTVSTGADTVPIPNIVGAEYNESLIEMLERLEIKHEKIDRKSDTVDAGIIIECSPAPGEEMPADDTLFIYVSSGKDVKMVSIPRLIDMTEGEAEYELTRLGLKMYSDTAYDATVPKGRIISQQPSPLVEVEEGYSVYVVVSLGPEPTSSSSQSESQTEPPTPPPSQSESQSETEPEQPDPEG